MGDSIDFERSLAMKVEQIDPVGPVVERSLNSSMCASEVDGEADRRKLGPVPQQKAAMDFAKEKKIILGVAFGIVGMFVLIVGVALVVILEG